MKTRAIMFAAVVGLVLTAAIAGAATPQRGTYLGAGPWARADVAYKDGKTLIFYFRSPKCTPGKTVWVVQKKAKGKGWPATMAQIPIAKQTGAFSFTGIGAALVSAPTEPIQFRYGTVSLSGSFPMKEQLTASITYKQASCSWTGTVTYKYAGNVS